MIACLFSILVFAALFACAHVARAFRLAPLLRIIPVAAERDRAGTTRAAANSTSRSSAEIERSRASAVASLLAQNNRRERDGYAIAAAGVPAAPGRAPHMSPSNDQAHLRTSVGRSFARRSQSQTVGGGG